MREKLNLEIFQYVFELIRAGELKQRKTTK